ncbi:hypothetical protein [Streptomyces termitum]|uniref:hypothetical protein n=1 Tax=Streptomyces termitum TaxID=67368 RepID=UPI0033B8B26D
MGTVLKAEKFHNAPWGGLERSADELIRDYATTRRMTLNEPMCNISADTSPGVVNIRFGLYESDDLFGDAEVWELHPYDMGVEARSGPDRAYIFFTCVSPRLEGSDKSPARIKGMLTHRWSELPDTVPVREANLTILHSVVLAVARKLGCENDAGLDAKPVFRPWPE